MKRITLDLRYIKTVRALHVYLQYMLDLPAHYGRNLDALYDCLSEMSEDLSVTILADGADGEMKAYLPRMMQVFSEAAEENVRLCVKR